MIPKRFIQLGAGIRLQLAALAVLSLLLATAIIAQMVYLSRVIHRVFMEGANLPAVGAPLVILLGLIATRAALGGLHHIVSQHGALRVKRLLRKRTYDRLLTSGVARLNEERTGELAATLTDGLDKIEGYFARYVPRAVHVMIVPLAVAVFVFSLDWLSGLILLFTGPLIPLFMWLIGTMAEKRTQKQWTALSRMSAHFLDVLQGLTTLKLFGRERDQERQIRQISNRYRVTTMGVLKVAFLSGLVLELAASLSTAIVAVQIGVRLVEGVIPFQLGLCILLLAPEFYLPFRQLGAEHHASLEGRSAADRLFELLAWPVPAIPASPVPIPPVPFDVTLSDVAYSYPGRDQPALTNISTTFTFGEITAIVGHSGSGKSTLFNLLTRQLEPDNGLIRAGTRDIQDIPARDWRDVLTVVPQRPSLFQGTIRDNLAMARPDASQEDIERAARLAEAHDFIMALPEGYATPVGEQAWRLSGGERQRLAIARAFLKNAPILLMDEPSSNLDPESEERMATAFERLARDRLVIIIAHRLRTIYRADRICVFDSGRLIEQGTHDELLERQGAYARIMGRSA